MGRAIKCYSMIDSFIKIFKLIAKKEVSTNYYVLQMFYRPWMKRKSRTHNFANG
jgi:hypothetical protein